MRFGNSVGRETHISKVWGTIKRMTGIKREYEYPMFIKNEATAAIRRKQRCKWKISLKSIVPIISVKMNKNGEKLQHLKIGNIYSKRMIAIVY